MKILKLLGIFLVIAAVIFGAVLWMNGGSHRTDAFVDVDQVDVTEKCEEIRAEWNDLAVWDKATYEAQREDIAQDSAFSLYSQDGYQTVRSTLREAAVNKVCDALAASLKADKFSDQTVQEQYQGVRFLIKAENVETDARVKRAEQLYRLYTDIKSFVSSRHTLSPGYVPEKGQWNNFSAQQQNVLRRAQQLRDNTLFAEMRTVPGFQDGLSEAKLKPLLAAQRPQFYRTLSQQILNHFAQAEPTQETMELFAATYDRYKGEELSIGVGDLASAYRNFRKQVEQAAQPAPAAGE